MILPRLRKKSPTPEKEMIPSAKKNNKLHVTVTLNEKELGVLTPDALSDNTQTHENALPSSEISIADLISDVKDDSGSFFKYLPDSMLNEARIASKNVAIAEDEERIA